MSEKNETNVINNFETPDGAQITLLHGKAPDPVNQSGYSFYGRIDAPGNYYEARKDKQQFNEEDCVVRVDYEKRKIQLIIFPDYETRNIRVDGTLELDHRLERFGINNPDKKYSRDELAQLFKFNRNAFSVTEEGMDFVKKLKDFSLKFNQAFQDSDDSRGNKKLLMERVISECNLPETITLFLPVFKGDVETTLIVDVLFSVNGSGDVVFYLESPELAETIDRDTIVLIDQEVERFPGIAIIYE